MNIVFMGTPRAAVPTLERILADGHEVVAVYTQPDRPSGRGNKITFSPVKEFAREKGLRVLQPLKIKTPEALAEFKNHNADVAVVVAYGRILPETFLTAFPGGAINVHFSLLPKYRGAAPVNWAIVNGETETGVTTMQVDAGLDTGAILLQRSTEIGPDENSIELTSRLAEMGAELLAETLSGIDTIEPKAQNHVEATLAPILNKNDGEFSWEMDAQEIANRVRGFQPFPGTFTFVDSRRLTLWSAKAVNAAQADPGTVLSAKGDELIIACGNGSALQIDELQPEGKRRMSARDFLNGSDVQIGEPIS